MIHNVISLYDSKFIPIAVQFAMMTIPNVLPVYFIAWEGNSDFDNSINGMKAKAFQFINSIVQNYKGKMADDMLVKTYTNLIQTSIQNLDFVVTQKYGYLKEMSKDSITYPDYNYENLLYQVLLFLARILVKDPFMDSFASFAKQ